MVISRRQTPDNIPASIIKLNNESISINKEINILGVQIDDHLTFASHVRVSRGRSEDVGLCTAHGSSAGRRRRRGSWRLPGSFSDGVLVTRLAAPPTASSALLDTVQNRALRLLQLKTP